MNKKSMAENCVFYSLESSTEKSASICKLDKLNESVNQHFKKRCGFDSFYLYLQEERKFIASVLFKKNRDIQASKKSGAIQELCEFVFTELEQAGYGKKEEVEIQFALESHERLDSENKTSKIPSEEDFARADKWDEEQSRGIDEVSEKVDERFLSRCQLHYFYLMSQGENAFRAYIFFKEDKDVEASKNDGTVQDIIDFVYAELERVGRGKRGDIQVAFEFDSDENVTANFEGDYFLRLR